LSNARSVVCIVFEIWKTTLALGVYSVNVIKYYPIYQNFIVASIREWVVSNCRATQRCSCVSDLIYRLSIWEMQTYYKWVLSTASHSTFPIGSSVKKIIFLLGTEEFWIVIYQVGLGNLLKTVWWDKEDSFMSMHDMHFFGIFQDG
jgi:hypothetical protein